MINRDSPSPWPEIQDATIVFVLDARDDFEVGLLREWVESERPSSDAPARYTFAELPRGRGSEWLSAMPREADAVWMQPLRVAWLPAPGGRGDRSLLDLFPGRLTEPGRARRRWLAKHHPERLAWIVGDGAWHYNLQKFPKVMKVIQKSPVIERLVSHVFPMSQVQEAFEPLATHQTAKVLLRPWE